VQPVDDPVATAERYRRFARVEAAGMSPTYEALALAVADDPRVLALLGRVEQHQQQPNLLFGAMRLLGAPVDDPAAALDEALAHPDEVLDVLRTRFTQTNEAGRCALLLPALSRVAGDVPVALVELGASAGLCLLPDRYRYAYTRRDGTAHLLGPARGPVLACEVRDDLPLPEQVPEIAWRAGLDRNPLDPADADDRRWLRALVWPEHADRRARLDAALEAAAHDPPRVVRGDVGDDLVDLLRQVPEGTTTVVTHTAVLAYVAPQVRERVRSTCREAGAWRLGAEGRDVLTDLAAPPADPSAFVVSVGHPDGTDEVVALAQPHGRWLERL
jgi:hypothetical protein